MDRKPETAKRISDIGKRLPISACRLLLCAASALTLAACGFHPLYGKIGGGDGPAGSLAGVYVEAIPERVGYELRNDLLDYFNTQEKGKESRYRLQVTLKEEEEPIAFTGDASITRYNYRLDATYTLMERAGDRAVKSGEVRSFTAYDVAQSPYATVAGKKDAQDRAALEIAERVRTELAVYFRNVAPGTQSNATQANGAPANGSPTPPSSPP